MTRSNILQKFDDAAAHYDGAAKAQAEIAKRLVAWAEPLVAPHSILDVGSGTGFIAEEAYRRWPLATITALDGSRAMLREAQRKVRQLTIIHADLETFEPAQKFDIVFSSMVLHWLPNPRAELLRWKNWLAPHGKIFAALPIAGSFQEWRDLCLQHKMVDGLWPLPDSHFADGLTSRTKIDTLAVPYRNVQDFLHTLKSTGASTPRPDYQPIDILSMRKILKSANDAFTQTYRLIFIEI